MERLGATGLQLLVMVMTVMLSDCQAGRVFFPGPSIGPAPPSLWQSLHTLRQARRLDEADDGAPELRAAGVRIGQKYSDLEQLPLLETGKQHQDSELQSLQDDVELSQPLELLDVSEPLEVRGQFDEQQDDEPLSLQINEVEHLQNSESLQNLAPLPFLLAAEPRGAEFSSNVRAVSYDPGDSNALSEHQHSGERIYVGGNQPDSDQASEGYSSLDPDDIITLGEASNLSKPVLVTGQIPEGVVYSAAHVTHISFNGGQSAELNRPNQETLPRRQDLQSSASVLDSTSVERPKTRPPTHWVVRPRASAVAVAEGPLRSDQNLLNVLVNQGVLRPVGMVRVARLRLVSDAEDNEEENVNKRGVFFAPVRSDDVEEIAKLDTGGGSSEVSQDEKRRYREEPDEKAPLKLGHEDEEAQHAKEYGNGQGWSTRTATGEERERVLDSNVVSILSEKEVFDRLVTPRASSSNAIAGVAPDTVPEAAEEPSYTEPVDEDPEDRLPLNATSRAGSLAARLSELGSRVSHQGVWGRRLSSAAIRRPTQPAGKGRQDDGQEGRDGGWQRRVDVGEPVFVDADVDDAVRDLDTEGSELHEVTVLGDEGTVLREAVVVLGDGEGEHSDEEVTLDDSRHVHQDVTADVDETDAMRWKATSAGTNEKTRSDIITERTVIFSTGNSTADEDTGPPQLVAEMFNCPEIGGNITLECRIKNAPQHEKLQRFWWVRRHFDGDDNAVRDELLAVNGVSLDTSNNISVQQVAAARQRLMVTAVSATDTGLYMCQAGWDDTLQEVEMLVFLCH